MQVLIRVDASEWIGSGHVMRCLTLAEEIRRKCRANIHFVCRSFPGHLEGQIRENGYTVIMLPDHSKDYTHELGDPVHAGWLGVSWQQDADETVHSFDNRLYDWLIVDHYGIDYRWHKKLRPFSKKIMVIDDLADRKYDCDLLLDQTYGRDGKKYLPYVPSNCQVLTGSQYALLRTQFSRLRHKALAYRNCYKGITRILLFMGGVDLGNVTGLVLDLLALVSFQHPPVIDVVLGGQSPHLPAIKAQAENHSLEVNVFSNVSNMAEMMLRADLAIGAGGTASWERCCLGLPTIVVQMGDNQQKLIQELDNAGVIVNLGEWSVLTLEKIKVGVEPFLFDTKYYLQMVENSFAISDGLGAQRVIKKLIGASDVVVLRLAIENDCEIIYKWQSSRSIRKYCRNQTIPSWSEHQEWFNRVLVDADRELYLVCLRDEPVGMVRLDKMSGQNDAFEISILITPEWQGKGVANRALGILRGIKLQAKFMAEVLDGNYASQKLFEIAGYKQIDATWFVSLP